jgi:hypothetical protein
MNNSIFRSMVKGFYDAQKLRMQVGLRIVANVKVRMGQLPGKKEAEMDDAALALIDQIRNEYTRITDSLTTINTRTKVKAIEQGGGIIADIFEYELAGYYVQLLNSETNLEKTITPALKQFPIFTEYLTGVKGCGPLMSAVIISELDPFKANRISGFWKYAGLDVIQITEQREVDEEYEGEEEVEVRLDPATGKLIRFIELTKGEGRCRKTHHMIDVDYINKKGKPATRRSITFNPFLKTKLVGVLAGSFLKCKSPYSDIYYGYKARLEARPDTALYTLGHRHDMAMRYMIKIFLQDLWLKWRELEGLEITAPYAEAKLGLKHGA